MKYQALLFVINKKKCINHVFSSADLASRVLKLTCRLGRTRKAMIPQHLADKQIRSCQLRGFLIFAVRQFDGKNFSTPRTSCYELIKRG